MLVIGLLAGFVAGFVVAQRMTPPSPPAVVQVPRPADSGTAPATVAPVAEPPVGTSANPEPPTVVEEPSVQQPPERTR